MDTSKIAYFINNPHSILSEDVKAIEDVKNKFPYCSTLHMLFIKGLANSNSVDFEGQLKKSAIHVNDREKLHDLINSSIQVEVKPVEGKIEIKPNTTKEKDIKTGVMTKPVIKEDVPIITFEDKLNTVEEPTKRTEEIKVVIPKTIEVKMPEKPDKVDMAKIIEDIRLKAEAARLKKGIKSIDKTEESNQNKEVKASIPEKQAAPIEVEQITESIHDTLPIEQKNEEIETVTESTKKLIDVVIEKNPSEKPLEVDVLSHAMETAFELDVDNIIRDTVSENDNVNSEPEEEEKSNEVDPDKLSFTEWLKYKQGKLKLIQPEIDDQKENIKLTKTEINTLLNKFIEEEPKMSRPQKEFYNPVKNAKKSLDESNVLVSETLAKIYWLQKKYDKAIKAYEQLSLRNPEKKSFFANQIKKIKQELNKL